MPTPALCNHHSVQYKILGDGWMAWCVWPVQVSVCMSRYLCELLHSELCPVELLFQLRNGTVALGAVEQRLLQLPDSPGQLVDLIVALIEVALGLLTGRAQGVVVFRFVLDEGLEAFHLGRRTQDQRHWFTRAQHHRVEVDE